MKYFFCILVFCLQAHRLLSQQCPEKFAGTKTLYPIEQPGNYTRPPKGYQPAFINYVGRHGARHLTKDVNTSFAFMLLEKAANTNGLTAAGEKLRQMVLALEKIEKTNFKSISNEGIQELASIATHMYGNYLEAFLSTPFTSVEVTKEKRTSQSATVFVNRIKQLLSRKDSVQQIINDTTLRFFDISPAYLEFEKNGNWQATIEQFKTSVEYDKIIDKTGSVFFAPAFLSTLSKKDLSELTSDIFGFITILPSIEKEIAENGFSTEQVNFNSFYTCDELLKLGRIGNLEDFLLKGPGTDSLGIQVKIAAPLLMDFMKTTDEFISGNERSVKLRFAHAETIAPFAALLNIQGASEAAVVVDSFQRYWKAEEIVPLSANIQWVLYRKKNSSKFLIKILLNEKEAVINGLKSKNFPYYSWKQLRSFYLSKLQHLGLRSGDNFNRYLNKLDR